MAMFCGVDMGSSKTIMVSEDGEIVLEPTGSAQRPSMVGFSDNARLIGEGATPLKLHKSTVKLLPSLMGKSTEQVQASEVFKYVPLPWSEDATSDRGGLASVTISGYNGESTFSSTELLGMYLAQMRTMVPEDRRLCFLVPADCPPAAALALRQACAISGLQGDALTDVQLVPRDDALVATLGRKVASLVTKTAAVADDEAEVDHCVIIDMGAMTTQVIVVRRTGKTLEKLATRQDLDLGAMHFDVRIFQHLAQVKGAGDPTPGSKRGLRLLGGAERLRKLLSQIRDASVTVENLTDDGDKTFKMSRGELVGVSQDLLARLEGLVTGCLSDAKVDATSVVGVELVGGGSRMVVVHEAAVFKLFGSAIPLHAKLDDTSASVGAAMLASERAAAGDVGHEDAEEGGCGLSGDALSAAVAAEQVMQSQDVEARDLQEARNAMEAIIFRWREAPNQKHGELIEREKLMVALDAAEMWMWDSEEANLADVRTRKEKLSSTVAECTAAFAAAEAAEKSRIEEELNVLAKEGDAERAATGDDEDHDNRKLPTKDRMRMVTKNKEEGTELFKGGNWRMAGARYSKALTHAAKFFDLSPEDAEQVKELKLSLYNNLTMCYIKMSNWDQVLRNTGEALTLDTGNAKALFRRAAAHEARKDWDKALVDLKSAAAANPDDKGIPKAQDRVRKMVEKEKAKEKKMWGNVFGK